MQKSQDKLTMEPIRFGARLRAARKAAGFKTSKTFLKESKIPASTYSQHESGARIPGEKILKFYSKIFAVNFDWLKEGKGLPYTQTNSTKSILEEELLDLSKFKPTTSLNQSMLTMILHDLLSAHANNISSKIVKKIVNDAFKIYENVVSADISNTHQMKLLKRTINDYKKKKNI
jgi:transcriptional regulator with XRE-family HTH domain